jgi:hypothetical protein
VARQRHPRKLKSAGPNFKNDAMPTLSLDSLLLVASFAWGRTKKNIAELGTDAQFSASN